jgi:hypothetical protein
MGYPTASELGRDHPLGWLAQLPPDQMKSHARISRCAGENEIDEPRDIAPP